MTENVLRPVYGCRSRFGRKMDPKNLLLFYEQKNILLENQNSFLLSQNNFL